MSSRQSLRVLNAMVDLAADAGLFHASLDTMRLAQCLVQAVLPTDPELAQLPGLDPASAAAVASAAAGGPKRGPRSGGKGGEGVEDGEGGGAGAGSQLSLLALCRLGGAAAFELLSRALPAAAAGRAADAVEALPLPAMEVAVLVKPSPPAEAGAEGDGSSQGEADEGGAEEATQSGSSGGMPVFQVAADADCIAVATITFDMVKSRASKSSRKFKGENRVLTNIDHAHAV